MTTDESILTETTGPSTHGSDELRSGAVSGLGVFAQGLAAAAPSVAIAAVPGSLFLVAGKGAFWAAIIGGVLVYLIAALIAFQARRTVSSGSLGTYAGNGLGPVAAFVTGWALILGYIGFAAGGVLFAVLYFNSFLQEIGLHTDHLVIKVLLLVVASAAAFYIPYRGVSVSVRFGLGFEIVSLVAISVILIAALRPLWSACGCRAVQPASPRHRPVGSRFLRLLTDEVRYIDETFGKVPGTVPTVQILNYLQAQHLDTDFYDHHFGDGAYLRTHRHHQATWHGTGAPTVRKE